MPRKSTLLIVVAMAAALAAVVGRDWLALAWNAQDYPTATPQARTEVAIDRHRVYIAAGVDGIELVDLAGGHRQALLAPRAPLDRVDDIAVTDGLLFALDATPPGHLEVYAISASGLATPLGAAVPVPVGPFSGVSAGSGVVAVSGGTSQLTLREYDARGRLGPEIVAADLGRGQPDMALRLDGALAAISTHTFGPNFGLTFATIRRAPLRLQVAGFIGLPEAGFSAGGFKPAHFPLRGVWHGDRFYAAHRGGLSTIDVTTPGHPRMVAHDPRPGPAMNAAVFDDTLDITRAGAEPAVYRYRLHRGNSPVLTGIRTLPRGTLIGATIGNRTHTLITLRQHGWRIVSSGNYRQVQLDKPHQRL